MQNINLYSKEQTDSLLLDKADSDSVYTKFEIETMLTEYYTKSETYSKTELDNEFNDIDDVLNTMYTQNEIDGLLLSKANVSDVYAKTETYSKTEIDTLLSGKADSSDLNNYYTKSETYSKTETNTLIQSLPVYSGVIKVDVPYTLTQHSNGIMLTLNNFTFKNGDMLVLMYRMISAHETKAQRIITTYQSGGGDPLGYQINLLSYSGENVCDFFGFNSSGSTVSALVINRYYNGTGENITDKSVYHCYVLRKATD